MSGVFVPTLTLLNDTDQDMIPMPPPVPSAPDTTSEQPDLDLRKASMEQLGVLCYTKKIAIDPTITDKPSHTYTTQTCAHTHTRAHACTHTH